MTRNQMVYYLKQILPYTNDWYNRLSDKQVYCIYCKYVLNHYKSKKDKEKEWYKQKAEDILNYYYLEDIDAQDEFLREYCELENIDFNKLYTAIQELPRPKTLCKRRDGMILADNGHWEKEYD